MSDRPPSDQPPPKAPRVRYSKAVRWKRVVDYRHKLSEEEKRFLDEFDAVEYGGNMPSDPDGEARRSRNNKDRYAAGQDAMNKPCADGVSIDNVGARTGMSVEDVLIAAIDGKADAQRAREREAAEDERTRIRARNKRVADTIKAGGRKG